MRRPPPSRSVQSPPLREAGLPRWEALLFLSEHSAVPRCRPDFLQEAQGVLSNGGRCCALAFRFRTDGGSASQAGLTLVASLERGLTVELRVLLKPRNCLWKDALRGGAHIGEVRHFHDAPVELLRPFVILFMFNLGELTARGEGKRRLLDNSGPHLGGESDSVWIIPCNSGLEAKTDVVYVQP